MSISLAAGLRRLLIETGRWDRVRERLLEKDPSARHWLDRPQSSDWQPVERHIQTMSAIMDSFGEETTRELGRQRLRESLYAGFLAPVLRSWVRGYAKNPSELLRVAPHVWRASTRNAGRIEVAAVGMRDLAFRVVDVPRSVVEASAWHRFLEGYCLGILEAGGHTGQVTMRPSALVRTAVDLDFRW